MPVELSERLSEYSYGYGVTREIENALSSVGLQTAPFLPNLIHEAKLGFDVGFDRPGAALMLQFKLGQSLKKFFRKPPSLIKPQLERPFWRFNIDTAEPDGQFELLLKAEQDGAEVYYAAPRFTDWSHYLEIFKSQTVVESSLLLRPSDIRQQLARTGQADGPHRIVYDAYGVHVCSSPAAVPEVGFEQLIGNVGARARRGETLGSSIRKLYEGLGRRNEIRRTEDVQQAVDLYERGDEAFQPGRVRLAIAGDRPSSDYLDRRRELALQQFRERAESEEAALAAVVATEAWAAGVQMVLVTPEE